MAEQTAFNFPCWSCRAGRTPGRPVPVRCPSAGVPQPPIKRKSEHRVCQPAALRVILRLGCIFLKGGKEHFIMETLTQMLT